MPHPSDHLRSIHNFKELVQYLEDRLGWPLQEYGFDDLVFEYDAEELGLKEDDAAKVKAIHQLRPLQHGQPWGIFFVEFEKKKLPVVVLRRILSHLVVKKRASANKANEAAWHAEDLLFVTAFGEDDTIQREIAFAHFHQSPGDLPTLRVLGWDGGDTPLKLSYLDKVLQERLHWPEDPSDHKAWRQQWRAPFKHRIGHVIRTADSLAEAMAALARGINDKATRMLAAESDSGPLKKLHKAFQAALIHDLTEESFADTYAQTITYGLLTAAISRTEGSEGRHGTFIIAENVTDMVPITNPFLREMLQTFLKVGGRKGGIDFDELGIQDVVDLLRGDETDLPAILRDFGNKTQGEDPVIHFYEHFLAAYNKKLKVQRGVFYTPKPVVSYIVRSVHELLQTEFSLEDGLASTVTWEEMAQKFPELKIPAGVSPGSPFVMVLDPATGTATFLVEVIDVIHKTMTAKWQKQGKRETEIVTLWNDYVPKHLLPRIYGYELMMAPYAIAHMKIGLKLFETGYQFMSDARVRVYLTNALEPASDDQQKLVGIVPALAHEAEAVNAVKRCILFTVIVGNPPYSKASQNLGEQFMNLIESFRYFCGERIREPGAILFERDINNDYVKFFGLNRNLIDTVGIGILGMITSNSYLDGKNFRGVRDSLTVSFNKVSVINLHGDSRSGALARQQVTDENVFEIETGVSIILATKANSKGGCPIISYKDIIGTYDEKAALLFDNSPKLRGEPWATDPRRYKSFLPSKSSMLDEYASFRRLDEIFNLAVDGIKTSRDGLVIANTFSECSSKIQAFMNFKGFDDEIREVFGISVVNWDYKKAQKYLQKSFSEKRIHRIAYRPFDFRFIYYDSQLVFSNREEKMCHLINGDNLALVSASRLSSKGFNHILPADCLVEMKYASHDTNSRVFPALLYGYSLLPSEARQNMKAAALELTGMRENSLDWIELNEAMFAILNSSQYRARYYDEVKNDFPGIPPLINSDMRSALASSGKNLIRAQLLKTEVPEPLFRFNGELGGAIVSPELDGNRLYISDSGYFLDVTPQIFDFNLAGYQVCKNWVSAGNKSRIQRKGTILTHETANLYRKVLYGIHETIRIMAEIDEVIDVHGGWPIK